MIKSSTNLLRALLLLVVAFWATLDTMADSPRKVVVEQFTSTTCGPCASANPTFHAWLAKNLDYVVPLIYHCNFPAPGDPMYTINPGFNDFFINKSGLQGIPAASVNGGTITHPNTLLQQNYSSITTYKGTTSPIDMNVEMTREGVDFVAKITITTSQAFNNYTLRGIVVEEDIKYNAAPGSNGEKEFPWVPRASVVDNDNFGEVISVKAGETKTFTYKFSRNSAWGSGNFYLAAFVQNMTNKEIYQAATSEKMYGNVTTAVTNPYLKTAPNTPVEVSFEIENKNTFSTDVDVILDEGNSVIPSGWSVNIDNPKFTLAKNGKITGKASISLKEGSDGLGQFNIAIAPSNKTDGPGDISYATVYVLNTDTKLGVYVAPGSNIPPFASAWAANSKYTGSSAILTTGDANLTAAYSPDMFQHILISEDKQGYTFAANPNMASGVLNALKNKKNVAVLSAFNFVAVDAKDQNTGQYIFTDVSADARKFFYDYVNVTAAGYYNLVQNNQLQRLQTNGVANDPIGKGLNVLIHEVYSSAHPYYTQYIPSMTAKSADVKPIFTAVNGSQTLPVGVRRELDGSRIVYLGFALDAVSDIQTRNTLLQRILEYIAPLAVVDSPVISVTSSVEFDGTEVGKSSTKSIEISNTGKAPLIINKVALSFDDTGADGYFTFDVKLPLTIAAGAKANIDVTFNPKVVEEYTDALDIYSNDENSQITSVNLSGTGLAGSSENPVITVSKQAIAFGKVGVGTSKTDFVTISNAGKNDLVVNEIYMNSLDNIFTISDAPTLPLTIKSGDTYELNVKFEPTAGQNYTNILNIKSNSESNASQTISLSGAGDATSVRDGVAGDEQVFTFSVGPNPFEVTSVVSYTVAASVGAQNVTMNLVDAKGIVVRNFINGNVEMGSYTLDINSAGLASGAYMLVANVGGLSYNLPVTIKK